MTDIYGITDEDREAAAADLDPAAAAFAVRQLELDAVERVLLDGPALYAPPHYRPAVSGPVADTGVRQ